MNGFPQNACQRACDSTAVTPIPPATSRWWRAVSTGGNALRGVVATTVSPGVRPCTHADPPRGSGPRATEMCQRSGAGDGAVSE